MKTLTNKTTNENTGGITGGVTNEITHEITNEITHETWPIPDYAEVELAYRRLAEAKAELHRAELELTIFKKELAFRAKPRQPVQREHGTTEEDKQRGIDIERALTEARIKVDYASAQVKFFEYVLSMYQSHVYLQTRGL